jgi:hypothetical protein
MDWLRRRLAKGFAPARDVQEEADAHGISKATVRRAFRKLGGEAFKTGFSLFGGWLWRLLNANPPDSH